MPRRINTAALQDSGGRAPDGYFDRVIKYIPGDVVAAWVAAAGIIPATAGPMTLWLVFAVGIVATAAWTWKQTQEPGKPAAVTQILVATAAFLVWVFALGGPFAKQFGPPEGWYEPYQGSLVLIGFTLLIGLVTPTE